ncbi:hypothetical protein GCM10020000_33600 [Streptomyces olivoverticillatus]
MTGDQPDDPAVAAQLPRAVATLRGQALVWGAEDRLRLVRTVRELLAPSAAHPSPTGLGPTVAEATTGMSPGLLQQIITTAGLPGTHDPVSAVASLTALFEDRTRMAALLEGAPSEAVGVLDRLLWGPPYGTVTADPAPPPALAARPRTAAVHRPRRRRPPPRGRPAPACRARTPHARAPRPPNSRPSPSTPPAWSTPRPAGRPTSPCRPWRTCSPSGRPRAPSSCARAA